MNNSQDTKNLQPEQCKYGQEPKSCTSNPMDCQCALDAALAQPEQEQDEVNIRSRLYQRIHELETQLAQPEQEPVAWADHGVVNWIADKQFKHAALLYEAPQRTWVGLDDEDDIDWEEGGRLRDLVEAIEAKLKEKNT